MPHGIAYPSAFRFDQGGSCADFHPGFYRAHFQFDIEAADVPCRQVDARRGILLEARKLRAQLVLAFAQLRQCVVSRLVTFRGVPIVARGVRSGDYNVRHHGPIGVGHDSGDGGEGGDNRRAP